MKRTDKKAEEIRQTKDYKEAVERIKGYKKGFEFSVPYYKIPTIAKKNGMRFILNDMICDGIIECIAIDESFDSLHEPFPVSEIYVRL